MRLPLLIERQSNLDLVRQTFQNLDMEPVLGYFLEHNTAVKLDYHNTWHCIGVTALCIRLLGLEGVPVDTSKELLVGALFHDFNHAGHGPDVDNIERSVKGIVQARNKLYRTHSRYFPGMLHACNLIRCTEFPFVHTPTTLGESILRDADLLYVTGSPNKVDLLKGLYTELKVYNPLMSKASFIEGNRSFYANATMYSDSGKRMWAAMSPSNACALKQLENSKWARS